MRLLIAGGGTGGHIYPALAVARSLRARAGAPELAWLGGHRGPRGGDRPGGRRSRSAGCCCARCAPPGATSTSCWTRSAWGCRSRRRSSCCSPAGRRRSSRPAATWRSRRCSRRAVLRIPSVLWDGNVVPGRSVRFVARLATVVAVSHPETAAALGHPRTYVTGTPIRSLAGVDVDEARERFGARPGERILLVFGGSQAVRRINDAVIGALPRLVERVRVVHVTGDAGYAAGAGGARGAAAEPCATATGPFPFLHDDMTAALAAADLAVGPGRGVHAGRGRRVRAADSRSSRTRTPRGHQRLNAEAYATPGRACWSRTRPSTPTAWSRWPGCSPIPCAHADDVRRRPRAGPARRGRRRRGPRAGRRQRREPLPSAAEIEAVARGARR